MKKLIAIGIVLLPSKEISEESIKLSKSIVDSRNKIVLNSESCIPHVTLVIGCIVEENIDKYRRLLKKLFRSMNHLS